MDKSEEGPKPYDVIETQKTKVPPISICGSVLREVRNPNTTEMDTNCNVINNTTIKWHNSCQEFTYVIV